MDERLRHLIATRTMIKNLGFKTQEINDKIYHHKYCVLSKAKRKLNKKPKTIKMVKPTKLSKNDKKILRQLDLYALYMTERHLNWSTNLVLHEINFCNSPISHVQRKHLNELKRKYLRKKRKPQQKKYVSRYANVDYTKPRKKNPQTA